MELREKQHTVYVNPYTGTITGQLTTWFGSTPPTALLDDLHSNLQPREIDQQHSRRAACRLWLLVLACVIGGTAHARTTHELVPHLIASKGVRRTRGRSVVTKRRPSSRRGRSASARAPGEGREPVSGGTAR